MADVRWIGAAADVKQVTTIAVTGTWATNDTGTLTINNKNLTVTVGSDVATTDVAAIIAQAVNQTSATSQLLNDESRNFGGQEIAEFTEIEATSSSSTITLTAKTAGVPFTVTASESTAGTGALGTPTAATTATGKHFADDGDNYEGGSIPSAGDRLVCDNGSVDILYNLGGLTAGTSLLRTRGYTGNIGLTKVNPAGYHEYRTRFLLLDEHASGIDVTIGSAGDSSPQGRTYIDLGGTIAGVSTVNLLSSAAASNDGPAVQIAGGTTGSRFYLNRGSISIGATDSPRQSIVAGLDVGSGANEADLSLLLGDDCSFNSNNDVIFLGGTTRMRCNVAATDNTAIHAGRIIVEGERTFDDLEQFGGTIEVLGKITTASYQGFGGTMDLTKATRVAAFTTVDLWSGVNFIDPGSRWLGAVDFNGCSPTSMGSGSFITGENVRATLASL